MVITAALSEREAPPRFCWTDFIDYAPHLLGQQVSPDWIVEGPLGTSISYSLPDEAGDGRVEFLELKPEMRAIVMDCRWARERTLLVHDGDWIRFNFSLSINMTMKLGDDLTVDANEPAWRIVNNPDECEAEEIIPAGEETVWITVCCKPDLLARISGLALDDLPDPLRTSLLTEKGHSFHEPFDLTARLTGIASDIIRTPLTGGLRVAYIAARCQELICLSLNQIVNPVIKPQSVRLSEGDIVALKEARSILIANFADPPTIKKLSRMIGINRNKVFYGFKSVFGMTIADFVQQQRLEEGKRLLRETDLSIGEIAHTVGFRHQCNFSTAVKKQFGLTPRQMRDAV